MFAKCKQMLGLPFRALASLFRRWPKLSWILAAVLVFALGSLGGVAGWVSYHLREAERAWQEDRPDDARAHLDACVYLRPVQAHLLGARIERLLGNYREAEQHLRECKSVGGVTERVQLEWVLVRALQGEVNDLERPLWESVKKNDPNSALILEALALCYSRDFRYRAAATSLSTLLEREPDNLRALDWRSWVWEKLGHKEGVYEDCRHALALCPDLWKVRLRLASTLLTDRNPVAANEHLRLVEQAHPDMDDVRLARARYLILQGQGEDARRALDLLLRDEPDSPQALFFRGQLEGDPVKAEKYFRRALDSDPFYNEAWYRLYLVLSRQGKDRTPEAVRVKARYEKNERDFQRLREYFEKFERSPVPPVLSEIGEIYLELEMPVQARKFFQRVLMLDRGNRRAQEVLDALDRKRAPSPPGARSP